MVVRTILLFLLSSSIVCPEPNRQAAVEFDLKLHAFTGSMNQFLEKYYGCRSEAVTPENCSPTRGTFDLKKWESLRAQARVLFDLEKKK